MSLDAERNSRLLLDGAPGSERALPTRRVPPLPVRFGQRIAMKAGVLGYERSVLKPLLRARREALGDGALGPPRFLVRVDEFPHYLAGDEPERYGVDVARRFHSILASAGVPYLMAVVPRVPAWPLDPAATGDRPLDGAEVSLIEDMALEGVSFGLHGYNHRTRFQSPRRRSELCGLSRPELGELIDRGMAELGERADMRPRVFVPPYNRFDARQYGTLAERFDVVCGGPESVPLMGFHPGPEWRDEAVYLPCYPPLYGRARECLAPAAELVDRRVGTWVPLVLHLGWEADDGFGALEELAHTIAPYAAPWDEFLTAVERSR